MSLPIFFWCTTLDRLENTIESLLIVETGFNRHACDVHIRINEECTGIADSKRIYIGNKITVKYVRKNSGERILPDSEMVGN